MTVAAEVIVQIVGDDVDDVEPRRGGIGGLGLEHESRAEQQEQAGKFHGVRALGAWIKTIMVTSRPGQ